MSILPSLNAHSFTNRKENYVLQHEMKSKVSIASIGCNNLPHTNPFWPQRITEQGTCVQIIPEGELTHDLFKKLLKNDQCDSTVS